MTGLAETEEEKMKKHKKVMSSTKSTSRKSLQFTAPTTRITMTTAKGQYFVRLTMVKRIMANSAA